MTLSRSLSLALASFALGLGACNAATVSRQEASAQSVVVEVTPSSIALAPGGRQDFVASVTGTVDTQVTWSVTEGAAGGNVSATGGYTAPSAPGTYHVVAASAADPTARATATVTVTTVPIVTVTVSPRTATVAAGGSTTFTAAVAGATNTAVTWSVAEASGCGSITATGRYTAPAAAATCHVVARSNADTNRSDTATVTVTAPQPVAITLAPLAGTVDACRTLAFTATVTGAANSTVTWSVTEGAAGGSVSGAGVYTAPDTGGTYHVVATSQQDPTKSQTATVTVVERILGVAVSPSTISIPPGGTAKFTATVTTTCGSFAQVKTVGPDGTVN